MKKDLIFSASFERKIWLHKSVNFWKKTRNAAETESTPLFDNSQSDTMARCQMIRERGSRKSNLARILDENIWFWRTAIWLCGEVSDDLSVAGGNRITSHATQTPLTDCCSSLCWSSTSVCSKVVVQIRWYKVVQGGKRWCKVVQGGIRWWYKV